MITPLLSVITNIGLDHTNLLGDTLEKIAGEKAGIIKKNIPVVIGESQSETKNIFSGKADAFNSQIVFADEIFEVMENHTDENHLSLHIFRDGKIYLENLQLDLTGRYQYKNILTVMAAIEELKKHFQIDAVSIASGLKNVKGITGLRGRWETLSHSPLVICDVGHNAEGISYVVNQIRKTKHDKLHFIFGAVSDKDISNILKLLPHYAQYYFCRADIPRAMDSELLAFLATDAGLTGKNYHTVMEAFNAAIKYSTKEDLVFIGGSTFVVAEVLQHLKSEL